MSNASLAFIFPGQGSQKVAMLSELAAQYPIIIKTFAEASSVLGYDLWQLCQSGSQEELNRTECTQPLLLSSSVAMWRVWNELSETQPSLLTGHSLGEWSALVCAGIVDFKDAIRLVQLRGRYMQEAVPAGEGAMSAIIGLEDDAINKACLTAQQSEVVAAVNFNSPGQVVIAGSTGAVERAGELCKEAGAKRVLPLPVSAPFHTSLMRPAADRLAAEIASTTFNKPKISVIHNVTAASEDDPDAIKELMIKQIFTPVPWVACTEALLEAGIDQAVECGPGIVLTGLCKRINKSLQCFAIDTPEGLSKAHDAIN
jgi:[acyl-carrier-protein] S-malonyltransferase